MGTSNTKNIVIVGGGTAGWITAGTLAAKFRDLPNDQKIEITLVESPGIPTIGVGEGTWPTMRGTLSAMGIRETDFIRECDAVFKQGAKFAKWVTGEEDDFYYHPLVLPEGFLQSNLASYWLRNGQSNSFANTVSSQGVICEKNLAPKRITTPEYAAELNYAYHLNAGKFAAFIQKHAVENLGVRHIYADVNQVNLDQDGYVASVSTEQAGFVSGDLFVDCTGFKSLLLGDALNTPFVSCQDTLFIDRALAVQCDYPTEDHEIASHTIATGQSIGWIWDIGLSSRRGIGHVYSSKHGGVDEAEVNLANYIKSVGGDINKLDVREIPINSGHRESFWKKNVVGIGLSAGFLEPLEASAIVLIEMSAKMLSDQLPANRNAMKIVAKRFNETFHYRWKRIIDFLKLHYCLTKRTDNQFWMDNRDPNTIPESLKELLELWRHQPPWLSDFTHLDEVFPSASYQYILYGMGFRTNQSVHGQTLMERKLQEQHVRANLLKTERLLEVMPRHRELINKIKRYGLQPV